VTSLWVQYFLLQNYRNDLREGTTESFSYLVLNIVFCFNVCRTLTTSYSNNRGKMHAEVGGRVQSHADASN
jgi:hypothetical protein